MRCSHRAAGHLGGAGSRRAAAGGAGRDDAPGGLRADGGSRRSSPASSTARCTSRWSGWPSTCPRTTSGRHPAAGAAQGAHRADGQPRRRLGAHRHWCPARGLIGFRTEFLTETRGTGVLHHVFEGYEPWHGELRTRPTAAWSPTGGGATTTHALFNLQERGAVRRPGVEVYEGMIVGENARAEDMDVNPTRSASSPTSVPRPPRSWCAWSAAADVSLSRRWSSSARMNASRSTPRRCGCARWCWRRPTAPASARRATQPPQA